MKRQIVTAGLLALSLGALPTACQPMEPSVHPVAWSGSPAPRTGRAGGFSGSLAWNGFSYRWAKHAHRLSILGSRVTVETVDPATGATQSKHDMSVKIGACPKDKAAYHAAFDQIRSGRIAMGHGVVRNIMLKGQIDSWSTVTRQVQIKLSDLTHYRLPKGVRPERVIVLLSGFYLRSPVYDLSGRPGRCRAGSWLGRRLMEVGTGCRAIDCRRVRSGWHFGGLGIRLGTGRLMGAVVEFPVWARVRPAESPDPVNGGDCRCHGADWPKSIPTRYTVDVHYTVLVGAAADLIGTPSRASSVTPTWTRKHEQQLEMRVQGAAGAGFAGGFVGLTGFDFALEGKGLRQGRYIRRLTARVDGLRYDPANGRAAYRAILGFSNQSPLAHRWKLVASLDATLVQIRDSAFRRKARVVKGAVSSASRDCNESIPVWTGW